VLAPEDIEPKRRKLRSHRRIGERLSSYRVASAQNFRPHIGTMHVPLVSPKTRQALPSRRCEKRTADDPPERIERVPALLRQGEVPEGIVPAPVLGLPSSSVEAAGKKPSRNA
jgi:hypothetical protein